MCKFCGRSDISYLEHNALRISLGLEQKNAAQGLLCRAAIDDSDYSKDNYQFLSDEATPKTVHPNLLEQAKLNQNYGLFLVSSGKGSGEEQTPHLLEKGETYEARTGDVFQIRGYDLASMTLVYDGTGWIVMDVLTTKKRANAVWKSIVEVYFSNTGNRINTVIYSHSHIDHYGGMGGLKEFLNEGYKILAPEGFTKHAVSENIYAGAAMTRRAAYQYGSRLPAGAKSRVDCGLGRAVAEGTNTLLVPTQEVGFSDYLEDKKYCVYDAGEKAILKPHEKQETIKPGNLILQMQYTPGTEAPAEMNVYLPGQKILFIAENCAGTLHNTLTPRGAEVRDPLAWANFLDETLVTFPDLQTVCSAHNWPHFGHEDSIRFIEIQRDMYRYINNTTLHLVNLGYTIDEVGRMLSGEDGSLPPPEDFVNEWCCHGFYGTYNHDAKAVYQRYMGWYDGNPAHLNRHKPSDRATKYVEAFGAERLIGAADEAQRKKDYAWAAELYDYIINADPTKITDDALTDATGKYQEALRQMGYASESPSWRNMYLTGALELGGPSCQEGGPDTPYLKFPDDTVEAMTLEMILQFLGIMLDSRALGNEPTPDLAMKITVKKMAGSDKETGECADVSVKASRGVLDYRIVPPEAGTEEAPQRTIYVEGTKLSFFRAFVEHDDEQLRQLISDKDYDTVKKFIDGCLTRFRVDFPIMTPRKKY